MTNIAEAHDYMSERYEAVKKLVAKYGVEGVRLALEQCELTPDERKPGGRPLDFDVQSLMQVWLFVEEGIARTGLSVHKFCEKAQFNWYCGGGPQGVEVVKDVDGSTLRRRYHQADAFIKAQSEPYQKMKAGGAKLIMDGKEVDYLSETERWWRQELAKRLAVKN